MFKQFPQYNPRVVASCFIDETISMDDWPNWLLEGYFEARKEILEEPNGR